MGVKTTARTIARLFKLANLLGLETTAQPDGQPSLDPNSGAILVGADTLDDRYYTEAEIATILASYATAVYVDGGLATKSNVGHTHDDRYFTEAEITALLAGKANTATTLAGYGITNGQPLDATLTALAGLATAADKLIYATGSDTFTTTDLSTFGRSLIDDASASAARTTLGLGTMATEAAANYAALAGAAFTGAVSGTSLSLSGTLSAADLASLAKVALPDAAIASPNAAGTKGEFRLDDKYLYVCVATNSWRRIALTDDSAWGTLFSPTTLSNVLQYTLDGGNAYESATLDGFWPLRSLESYGTHRKPRAGRAMLFDGLNDYATLGTALVPPGATSFTITAWLKSSAASGIIASEYAGLNARWLFRLNGGKIQFLVYTNTDSSSSVYRWTTGTYNDGTWHHVAATYDAGTITIYVDGVAATMDAHVGTSAAMLSNSPVLTIGALISASSPLAGSLYDVRMYSTVKTAAQVLAIKNQASTPTVLDTTGLLGGWWFNSEAGTTAYDWSGNGKHLTLTNIQTSTFHAADTGVSYNAANFLGFTNGKRIAGAASGTNWANTNSWLGDQQFTGNFQVDWRIEEAAIRPIFGLQSETTLPATQVYNGLDIGVAWASSTSITVYVETVTSTHTVNISVGSIVSLRRTGTSVGVYVDGVLAATKTVAASTLYPVVTCPAIAASAVTLLRSTGSSQALGANVTLSDLVVPRNEASTAYDVLGNALQYSGKCPHPPVIETPCITGDGTAVHLNFGSVIVPITGDFELSLHYYHVTNDATIKWLIDQYTAAAAGRFALTANANNSVAGAGYMTLTADAQQVAVNALQAGTWHLITIARSGSTFTLTVTPRSSAPALSGSLTYAGSLLSTNTFMLRESSAGTGFNDGRICDFRITAGGVTTYFPMQGGPGSSNTNRDLPYIKSDGTYGVVAGGIVNGTVATIWANRCPGYAQDWCVLYGGRVTTQNLLAYSEQFDNAAWTKTGTTVTANAETAPDGAATMDKWVESVGGTSHAVTQNAAMTNGTVYRLSVYAKAAGNNYIGLFVNTVNQGRFFDLATGSVGNAINAAPTSSSITSVGNGIYRCDITFTATGTNRIDLYSSKNGVAWNYSGDGTSGVYLWGAQVCEATASASAYQPTASAAVDANRFIPGLINSGLCADGRAKTLMPGKHGNPNSRRSPNPWDAPEMRAIGYTPLTLYAPGDAVQSVAPADTKFRRSKATGEDRQIAVSSALTSTTKSNTEAYVA